jgi:hypothetical protein
MIQDPDPGVKKAPDPGSRIRIRNIAGKDPDRGALNGSDSGENCNHGFEKLRSPY